MLVGGGGGDYCIFNYCTSNIKRHIIAYSVVPSPDQDLVLRCWAEHSTLAVPPSTILLEE